MPKIDPGRYVTAQTYGGLGQLDHLDGTAWDDAPIPSRWHRCWPQTRMLETGSSETWEKCPCGGVRIDGPPIRPWSGRNTRRARTPAEQADHERHQQWDTLVDQLNTIDTELDGKSRRGEELPAGLLTRRRELYAQALSLANVMDNERGETSWDTPPSPNTHPKAAT